MPFSKMPVTRLATFDVTLLMLMPSSFPWLSTTVTLVLGLSTSSSLPFSDSPLKKEKENSYKGSWIIRDISIRAGWNNIVKKAYSSCWEFMVKAQVASSVCILWWTVWYVFEFSLSSITPWSSKSEYIFLTMWARQVHWNTCKLWSSRSVNQLHSSCTWARYHCWNLDVCVVTNFFCFISEDSLIQLTSKKLRIQSSSMTLLRICSVLFLVKLT